MFSEACLVKETNEEAQKQADLWLQHQARKAKRREKRERDEELEQFVPRKLRRRQQ